MNRGGGWGLTLGRPSMREFLCRTHAGAVDSLWCSAAAAAGGIGSRAGQEAGLGLVVLDSQLGGRVALTSGPQDSISIYFTRN